MAKLVKSFIVNTVILTGVSLACYLLLAQVVEISGDSMSPTVKNSEWVLAEKISPKFIDSSATSPYKGFRRGEIVVYRSPEKEVRLLIKRIVGLPNETIKIRYGLIYIDGKLLNEKYIPEDIVTSEGAVIKENEEYKIGEDEYVMLGDNRENSIDSREYGAVKKQSVLGRALFVYKPIQNFRLLVQLRQQ